MKAGRGHVCNINPHPFGADQTLLDTSPCRYRDPFGAPRGGSDSLAMTFNISLCSSLFFCVSIITLTMLTHIPWNRLPSPAFLPLSKHRKSPSPHQKRSCGGRKPVLLLYNSGLVYLPPTTYATCRFMTDEAIYVIGAFATSFCGHK